MTNAPVTLITGGSSGIGASAARQLLGLGHRVAVTGRDADRLAKFRASAGEPDELLTFRGDAADNDAVSHAVTATVEAFGRLDNAVANAGYATHDDVVTGDPTGWRDMVLTNVLGPALLIRAATEHLKETQGRIVIVGSVAGMVHTPGNIYGATKWAMTGLAENTRRMVTADGVGVTLVAPGRTDSGFWDQRELDSFSTDGFMSSDAVAASIVWAVSQPAGVDVNTIVLRPVGQEV